MPRSWNRMNVLVAGPLAAMLASTCLAGTLRPGSAAEHIVIQDAASARVDLDGKTVYFDPFFDEKTAAAPADLILITHGHERHCEPGPVSRVLKPETVIVAPRSCAARLRETVERKITTPVPGRTIRLGSLTVEPVAAYTPDLPDHPKSLGGVGYVLTIGGAKIYHSGSTALVPELEAVRADVALLAFWDGYILSTTDAASLARSLGAQVVIPIHCKPEDAVKLRDMLQPDIRVDLKGHKP
jgi:L-ascorbate metabolism protein UlaG (beta-lactamase superfamily)